ncbi:response regulator [Aureimonas leprariae]|uniref:Response regulator n=1 Tax=Plantimonas leprariae TaxID=2615207 RepID=A0A7V7PKL2_9HYPH|nr:response regulator [Aureimonas leprariae]
MPISLLRRYVLVVEDEYLQADELRLELLRRGAVVAGPVASIGDAFALIDCTPELAVAVLDVNLDGRMIFPVADELLRRGVPLVFVTGYDRRVLPVRFANIRTILKPASAETVIDALTV